MRDRMDFILELEDQLAAKVTELQGSEKPGIDWISILQEAIRDRKVLEIEYRLDFRIKSFILPAGTEIKA